VVIDNLNHHLGILGLYLFLLIALGGNLLLAFPLVGSHAVVAWFLLLLLTELLRKLLDLSALLGAMAPGVVHRAPWTALINTGGLSWPLIIRAMTPISHCSSSSGCFSQLLVVAVGLLLLPISIFVAALSSDN
jgi:hypothetical protein